MPRYINILKGVFPKHEPERCSLGPTKGLEESELLALASIGLILKNLIPKPTKKEKVGEYLYIYKTKERSAMTKLVTMPICMHCFFKLSMKHKVLHLLNKPVAH